MLPRQSTTIMQDFALEELRLYDNAAGGPPVALLESIPGPGLPEYCQIPAFGGRGYI